MIAPEERRRALDELYRLLVALGRRVGGPRRLGECTGRLSWPDRGVYLFFEPGEMREDGSTRRIVRVGTHGLTATSRTTLWDRLRTHRGTLAGKRAGGGNHRGSVFRLHVGQALIARNGWEGPAETWAQGSSAPSDVRDHELPLEREVSRHLGAMDVLWVAVPDRHDRAAIERGLIGLLSNLDRHPVDPPSADWLGLHSPHPKISQSGLWNVNHVDEPADPGVIRLIERTVTQG